MANFRSCIADARERGEMDDETADRAGRAYDDAFAQASGTKGPDEADREAGAKVMDGLRKEEVELQRRALLQFRRRNALYQAISDFKARQGYEGVDVSQGPPSGRKTGGGAGGGNGSPPWTPNGTPPEAGPFKGGAGFSKALPLLMRNRGGLSGGPFPSVEGRYLMVRGRFDAMMNDVINKFETHTGIDTPNRAILENVVREAFGENTGDVSAKQLARAWSQTAELARKMFNEAGGAIASRGDWGMPQTHNAAKVYRAGVSTWVDSVLPLLDRAKMVDNLTGAPMGDATLRAKLEATWKRIVTNGLVDRHPNQALGVGSTALQRGEERFMSFKDADSWLKYAGQFGRSDAFDAMMAHLDGLAKDIGAMQILGPDPEAQFQWLKRAGEIDASQEYAAGEAKALELSKGYLNRAQAMWDAFDGAGNVPVNEALAVVGHNVRAALQGVQLGSAILTDMPSAPFFGAIARTFSGVSATGDVGQLVRLLADPSYRDIAKRLEFINEVSRDGLVSSTQDSLRLMTVGAKAGEGANAFARRLPPFTLRMSGLSGLFEARKRSFRMSFMGALADAADSGKSLDDLSKGSLDEKMLATELAARGFTQADWDTMKSAPIFEPEPGARFMLPSAIDRAGNSDLGMRVGEMVLNLEQMAVPVSGSLWTRAALLGNFRPGTVMGEMTRSFAMYKTFVVNAFYQYAEEMGYRAMQAAKDAGMGPNMQSRAYLGGKFGWPLAAFVPLTLAGAVTVQLKQLAKGNDPLNVEDPKFWGAAATQGGGFGILGDFYYSAHSSTGHTAGTVSLGPVADAAADAWDLTGQEALDAADRASHPEHADRRDHEGQRLVEDLRKYSPAASLWWSRAAWNRGVVDQLQRTLDPYAVEDWDRAKQRMMRDSGQEQWWPQGSPTPQRAPNLGSITRH